MLRVYKMAAIAHGVMKRAYEFIATTLEPFLICQYLVMKRG